MKLDASLLRYLAKEEMRLLTAVEQGMKNHEMVPTQLIFQIAKIRPGEAKKALSNLHRHKLVWHSSEKCIFYKKFCLRGY